MSLPIQPPLSPMLAKLATDIPTGDGWLYEPKWDGFRCIVFRDGDSIELASRNERPFTRYFPELLGRCCRRCRNAASSTARSWCPPTMTAGSTSTRCCSEFTRQSRASAAWLPRHPLRSSRSTSWPSTTTSLLDRPLVERHRLLAEQLKAAEPPIYLCPHTTDAAEAQRWFTEFEGAGLDGVVAKRLTDPYTPDKRTLIKVKHQRTADCVIAGYRVHKDGNGVGSLLLGLYDDNGRAEPRRCRRRRSRSSGEPNCSQSSSR